MMNMKKTILIMLALLLAACLGAAALAEESAGNAAADAARAAADEAQAAADAAEAGDAALKEALEAYGKAKAESRKLSILTSLKEELDRYVTEGSLTQGQADLILKYYAEQLTLQQQDGSCFGRDGRGGRGGKGAKGFGRGISGETDPAGQSGGRGSFGGRHGRFGNTVPDPQQSQPAPDGQETGSI